ncbi:hypothetical protein AMAG_16261 [Allomyces macrogynus ATCC 38327]|uniref:F-box domain-containing protein n=1 Tax=Allomyces macrogynus (strain ATCC 38327) TaxID=578462 RepID=A0A0L0TAX7_ALLM3|nr:hypothetical protein AMAG_16261 [Allomyces macrogynus ATCC 38327]|eukprot:KNE71709.1 hypothetical protein AMAG_16261 [Allomyces macrogynus ATCC 38327]
MGGVEHLRIFPECSDAVTQCVLTHPLVADRVVSISIGRGGKLGSLFDAMVFPHVTKFSISSPSSFSAITSLPTMPNCVKIEIEGSADEGAVLAPRALASMAAVRTIDMKGIIRLAEPSSVGLDQRPASQLWKATLSPSALRQFHTLATTMGYDALRALTHLDVDVSRDGAGHLLSTDLTRLTSLISLRITGSMYQDCTALRSDVMMQLAQLPHLEELDAAMFLPDGEDRFPLSPRPVFPALRRVHTSVQFFTYLRRCTFPALQSVTVKLRYDLWGLTNGVYVPRAPMLTSWMNMGCEEVAECKYQDKRLPVDDSVHQQAPRLLECQLRVPDANRVMLLRFALKLKVEKQMWMRVLEW